MGAHGSKEKLSRSSSERYVHTQYIERERFGSFGKRTKGKHKLCSHFAVFFLIKSVNFIQKIFFT